MPPRPIVFELPAGATGRNHPEGLVTAGDGRGQARLSVAGPFAPGVTNVQFAYSMPYSGGSLTIEQTMPVPLARVIVLAQKVGEMRLTSPQMTEQREMPAEGQMYVVGQGPAVGHGRRACRSSSPTCRTRRCGPATGSRDRGRDPRGRRVGKHERSKTARTSGQERLEKRRGQLFDRAGGARGAASRRPRRRGSLCVAARRARRRARARLRGDRSPGRVIRARMDFTSLSFADVSRSYGRRWALNRVSLRCESRRDRRAARSQRRRQVDAARNRCRRSCRRRAARSATATTSRGRRRALRQRIGLVGHDLYLYPELTAAENLTFYGRLHRVAGCRARVDAALERAQLTARRDDPVQGFSRGMRQRLTLERALLHDPRLVLLDEPFTGLDDASSSSLVARLEELRARRLHRPRRDPRPRGHRRRASTGR